MQNWKKLTAAILASMALLSAVSGCGSNDNNRETGKQATRIVTDLKGREVIKSWYSYGPYL